MKVTKIITAPIGTNTYIIDDKIVIDPGTGIGKYISSPVDVLITHGHYDHISGLKELEINKVFISKPDMPMLRNPRLNASVYFDEPFSWEKECYDISDFFNILLTPGHTMGSCIIFIENYIFTGDTLFSSSVGRTDLEGGSEELLKKSLELLKVKLAEIAGDSIVAPGHDMQNNEKLYTVSQILKINPFLKTKNHIL